MEQRPSLDRLNELVQEISIALNEAGIPYLVYGSYAYQHYINDDDVLINDIDIIVNQSDFDNIQHLFEEKNLPYKLYVSEFTIHANHNQEIGNDGKPFDISFDSFEHYFSKFGVDIGKFTKKILSDEVITHLIKKDDLMKIYDFGSKDATNPKSEKYEARLTKLIDLTKNITKQNVNALGVMEKYANKVGTVAYAWGGLIVDIYENTIVREHDDVEHIVLNLYNHIDELIALFQKDGWETEILINGDLRATKSGAKLHLGHLKIHDDIAKWFHNGNKGVIEFPSSWLNPKSITFLEMDIHAVLPEFQYVLKTNPALMNPEWEQRDKDLADIKKLENLLADKYDDLSVLKDSVNSIVLKDE